MEIGNTKTEITYTRTDNPNFTYSDHRKKYVSEAVAVIEKILKRGSDQSKLDFLDAVLRMAEKYPYVRDEWRQVAKDLESFWGL